MLALRIILAIILILLYIVMVSVMIIFERDKPRNMIVWSIIFLFTSIIGYIVYISFRIAYFKNKQALLIKQQEDIIYKNLINDKLSKEQASEYDELYLFNKLGYNARLTEHNLIDVYNDLGKFTSAFIKEINQASKYILFELTSVNVKQFEEIKLALISKAKAGVMVKILHDFHISFKLVKQLKRAGIKIYKFSRHNTCSHMYQNMRNIISIDGKVCFCADLDLKKNQLKGKYEVSNMFLKFKGDIAQDINLAIHQDIIFASKKYIDYQTKENDNLQSQSKVQYVTNEYSNELELVIIKAICLAKKSIQLQLEEFIPTESIMSLLRFAIHSNIEVRLMVPLKTNKHSKYFASRAYAKELALYGANVYLYDGYIRYNAIIIDDNYALCGSYTINREYINTCVQNIFVIEDVKFINTINKMFTSAVENSYRISNAKYMLLREKFFKNFV